MSYKKTFEKRDPIFASRYSDFLADGKTIERQSCPNWRCRGNVNDHCVYNPKQYSHCGDKDKADSDFFKYD